MTVNPSSAPSFIEFEFKRCLRRWRKLHARAKRHDPTALIQSSSPPGTVSIKLRRLCSVSVKPRRLYHWRKLHPRAKRHNPSAQIQTSHLLRQALFQTFSQAPSPLAVSLFSSSSET
ncbi:unnamed protein product [Linum trigynum]|uniref:Uncharacterized protein n=1 Tax=Linum trigynum TaxID=586398 RepID=A0AAV2E5U9_9ROSI